LVGSQANPKIKRKPNFPPPQYLGKSSRGTTELSSRLKKSKNFNARKLEIVPLHFYSYEKYQNVLLLGLGSPSKWKAEVARESGAALYFAQKKARLANLAVDGNGLFAKSGSDISYDLQAFCEGYWLAGYRFHNLMKEKPPGLDEPIGLNFVGLNKNKKLAAVVQKAKLISQSIMFARSLGDRPGNHLTPSMLAKIVKKMSLEKKIKCTVFDEKRLAKEKMGLLLGVGAGSKEESRLIILEYKGGKASDQPIALVGKGITFDSGGISLKPSSRMEEMKYDMMGAATVAGVCMAVSALKLPINLTVYIASAENMPSSTAQKPGDVVYSSNGKSVEITNTDAEGRLVLADALEYAQKQKPQAIIDFATLTGAVVVALGNCCTGIMGNSTALMDRIRTSSKITDEKVWELPLFEEYEDFLRSPVADIKNSSEVREAGAQKGGTFLKFFIDKKYPWVHCDIAGSGMQRRDKNYMPRRYGAGVMIRLMTHMLENWKPLKKSV